jgi:uncharacterized protein (DUF2147 family)
MKKLALVVAILAVFVTASVLWAETPVSPVGKWKTISAETGKPEYIVTVYDEGGKIFGKVTEILNPADKNKVCDKCPGADKGKPVMGFQVIRNLKADGDQYTGGTICDTPNGKWYKAKLKVVDGGKKLKVSGCIAFICRSQTWLKAD